MSSPSLPPPELLRRQAEWLAPARARLLRRAEIARRLNVLDLACGHGAVTPELIRRSGGRVVALDCSTSALASLSTDVSAAAIVCGNAEHLPFADQSFDLVFCQFALLWLKLPAALGEIRRVLTPGGVLAAIEPDYGGLIEYPPEMAARPLWLAALARADADPCVGRKLPGLLASAGFQVEVELLDRLLPPSPVRFELLAGLPLEPEESASLEKIQQADRSIDASLRVAHLPLFLIKAEVALPVAER